MNNEYWGARTQGFATRCDAISVSEARLLLRRRRLPPRPSSNRRRIALHGSVFDYLYSSGGIAALSDNDNAATGVRYPLHSHRGGRLQRGERVLMLMILAWLDPYPAAPAAPDRQRGWIDRGTTAEQMCVWTGGRFQLQNIHSHAAAATAAAGTMSR